MRTIFLPAGITAIFLLIFPGRILACPVDLGLDSVVMLALKDSYRIKKLELEIHKTELWLEARRASLKSSAYLNLSTPDFRNVSEYEWNSTLMRDEIVRHNSLLWQSELSVRQPVILLGYPTNGYVSINYTLYEYLQKNPLVWQWSKNYYNRLYLKFEQPILMPNKLKNDLEDAELNLRDTKLRYVAERVGIISEISRSYYSLFDLSFSAKTYQTQLANLQRAREIFHARAHADSISSTDSIQIELEYVNVQENLLESQSRLRQELANLKQRLRINPDDSIFITPSVNPCSVVVRLEDALRKGQQLNSYLQRLQIGARRAQLELTSEKGKNAFSMRLELTYGVENSDEQFLDMWSDYNNSNTVRLNAYVPIWDWGERKARILSRQCDIDRAQLDIQESREDLKKNITNDVNNLAAYRDRFSTMQKSMSMADTLMTATLNNYLIGRVSTQDVLQVIIRHKDTMLKLGSAWFGYRRSLLGLLIDTYYDYEHGVSFTER